MSKPGRKPKLTPARQNKIVEALRRGNTRRAAARLAGIGQSTLSLWLAKGREGTKGDDRYVDLLARVTKAEAEAESRMVETIVEASVDTWQAAAWYLERRYPDDFGKRIRADISVDEPIEIVVEIGKGSGE